MPSPSRLAVAAVALLGALVSTCAPHAPEDATPLPRSTMASLLEGAAGLQANGSDDPLSGGTECPAGMIRVAGDYCPDVEQRCLRWLDPPGKYHEFRCAEYASPAVCRAPRRAMTYCIDEDEQRLEGLAPDPRPSNNVTYGEAKNACSARGARLCTQSEWQFACEGEDMRPYPYGFVRDSNACNIDHFELGKPGAGLKDLRSATGEHPKCTSAFGVRDLAGNLEEWVTHDPGTGGKATLLKGSWWLPGKSTCRATNAGHDEVYHGTETGFRCCR